MSNLSGKHAAGILSGAVLFTSKVETLIALALKLKHAKIPPLQRCSFNTGKRSPEVILNDIQACFHGLSLAIRSSAAGENGARQSMAWVYSGSLQLRADGRDSLCPAVDEVRGKLNASDDAFCIEPTTQYPDISGVVMTRDLAGCPPYYVLNCDDEAGRIDTVTHELTANKTVYALRDDIKFAFDALQQCFILRVRPMTNCVSPDAPLDARLHYQLCAAFVRPKAHDWRHG